MDSSRIELNNLELEYCWAIVSLDLKKLKLLVAYFNTNIVLLFRLSRKKLSSIRYRRV